ncbi:hypothetical protein [Natronorubrum texcoconense]|uniref:DUF2892 domain-containing protein n=1 Tax=Natronorubrum texcoconense TaxID=1095776 RepID=A0A1G9GLC9_9EURY|nr:hypothetical protein [Natronorubrum texcoconense]SDL01456.1 hypothetical protein SAMN04515672_4553 [Natronorubrum texcoconense]
MAEEISPALEAYLRSIRTILAAVVLAILAVPFLANQDEIGLYLAGASILVLAYSLVSGPYPEFRDL